MKTMKYRIFSEVQSTIVNSTNSTVQSTTFLNILIDHSSKSSIIFSIILKCIKHLDAWVLSEELPFTRDIFWSFG